MAEEVRSDKKTGFIGRVFLVLGALLLMAVVYVSAVLLQIPDADSGLDTAAAEPETVPRMQPAAMNDAQALSELFGAPLPYLPGYALAGQGDNVDYEGANARLVTLQYPGATITAVRPAAAAPLLLHEGMSVSLHSDLSVLNLPAMLAEKGNERCVYFSSTQAAYTVYTPSAASDAFLHFLEQLEWTE